MATSTNAPLGTSRTATTQRRDTRLSTETKAAPKTTEFVVYLVILAGILISGLVVDDAGEGGFTAQKVWLYATILTVGYMVSRGLAKSGSRDPYFDGGTNQDRDNN
jgi:hypothetical protein